MHVSEHGEQIWIYNLSYACAMYITSYISKAEKEMSQLLQRACDEAREGNSSIKQQVRDTGNSAQEAVCIVLQLLMRNNS